MKRNNKGFTLVEIIAVVTILGILIAISMPKILDLVGNSRDEMYVQDAKKLIAQAQYVLSSKSDEIEKPVAGDYIVLSLNYLGTDAFSSPPNGGTYLPEASFVVVKNIQDPDADTTVEKYKFSVVLVEEAKDGFYRGIKLRTEEELAAEGAKTLVDYFDADELVYVDEDAATRAECSRDDCVVNNQYINTHSSDSKMKPSNEEDDNVTGRYNVIITQTTIDDQIALSAPDFDVKVLSSSVDMQMLKGTISVTANDPDNDVSELKVCIKMSKQDNNDFPSVDDASACHNYRDPSASVSSNDSFTYSFDLSSIGFTYEDRDKAYFYIVVVDPDGNYSRKRVPYEVHKNTAPEILEFTVRRHTDNTTDYKLNYVSLSANIKDDMDDNSKLKVCIVDKSTKGGEVCNASDYKDYNYYFGTNNKYYFKDNSGALNSLDGSKHYLTLFVKDTNGLVSQAYAKFKIIDVPEDGPYEIYKNQPPTLEVKLEPKHFEKNGKNIGNKLEDVKVNITVSDDMTSVENIKIKIGDKDEATIAQYKASTYLQNYTFTDKNGNIVYDGESRKLKVTATDEAGEKVSVEVTLDNVYKNSKPEVTFTVTSNNSYITKKKAYITPTPEGCVNDSEDACFTLRNFSCNDRTKCIGSLNDNNVVNGSYTASISANFDDDIDNPDQLMACLSENKDDCNDDSKFVPASTFHSTTYDFAKEVLAPYVSNPKEKTLYFVVKDSYGEKVEKSVNYSFYENQAPKFTSLASDNITSTSNINISSVRVKNNFAIEDDFGDYDVYFCYVVKDKDYDGGVPKKEEFNEVNRCKRVQQNSSMNFEFLDEDGNYMEYNGQKVYTMYKAIDGYDKKAYIFGEVYELSANTPPVIEEFTVETTAVIRDEKTNEILKTLYNSVIVKANFRVSDPEDTYTICLTTYPDVNNYCDAKTDEGKSHYRGIAGKGAYDGNSKEVQTTANINLSSFSWDRTEAGLGKWKYSTDVDSLFRDEKENGEEKPVPTVMLCVKDSSDAFICTNEDSSYRYIPRYSCSVGDAEYQKVLKMRDQEGRELEEGEEKVNPSEIQIEIESESEFEPIDRDTARREGQDAGGNNVQDYITPTNCKGLCYEQANTADVDYVSPSFQKTNPIVAYFRKQITYTDKLVKEEVENYKLPEPDSCTSSVHGTQGCTYASCFDIGSENKNVISLHLYEPEVKWTAKAIDITSIRLKYNSYCRFPETKNDLLFWRNDYRFKMDRDVLCNIVSFKISCEETYIGDLDTFTEEDPPADYEDCDTLYNKPDKPMKPKELESAPTEYYDCNTINDYVLESMDTNALDSYHEFLNAYNKAMNDYYEFLSNAEPSEPVRMDDMSDDEYNDLLNEYYQSKQDYDQNKEELENELNNTKKNYQDTINSAVSSMCKSKDEYISHMTSEELHSYNEAFNAYNNALNSYNALIEEGAPVREEDMTDEYYAGLLEEYEKTKEDYSNYVDETKEIYQNLINSAISFCQSDTMTPINTCMIYNENVLKYNIDMTKCGERNKEKENRIEENRKNREAYYKKISTCTNDERKSCNEKLDAYKDIDYSEGKIETSCSDSDAKKVLCKVGYLDGKCLDANCTEEGDSCKPFCYKDLDCNETEKVNLEVLCNGYFKLYSSVVVDNKVTLRDTGMRICPELFSSKQWASRYDYKDSNNKMTPYIKFFPSDYGGVISAES